MQLTRFIRYAAPALLIWAGSAATALAETAAGTDISNTATVNYKVGTVSQTAVTGSTTFKTDLRVNFTVAEVSTAAGTGYQANPATGYLPVGPGTNAQPILFQVSNTSNGPINIKVAFSNSATSTAGNHGGTDSFSTTGNSTKLDDGNLVYDGTEAGVGTMSAVPAGASRYVWVLGNVANQPDGALALGVLTATAVDGSDVALVETASDTAAQDIVLADDVGSGPSDAARDAKFTAMDGWLVVAANLAVTKTAVVITDPINCTTPGNNGSCTGNPKAIPGAVVEYTITVTNTGADDASEVDITDPVPANTTYVDNSLKVDGVTCPDDEVPGGPASTADGCSAFGGFEAVLSTIADTSGSATVVFRVTID